MTTEQRTLAELCNDALGKNLVWKNNCPFTELFKRVFISALLPCGSVNVLVTSDWSQCTVSATKNDGLQVFSDFVVDLRRADSQKRLRRMLKDILGYLETLGSKQHARETPVFC